MKTILIALLVLLLSGCFIIYDDSNSNNLDVLVNEVNHPEINKSENTVQDQNVEHHSPENNVFPSENQSIDIKTATMQDLLFFNLYNDDSGQFSKKIMNKFKYNASAIVITKDYKSIAWMHEGELLNPSESDLQYLSDLTLGKNDHGKYIYCGNLTEIEKNIYSSQGTFLPSAEAIKDTISETIDFYIIINHNELYLITEDLNLQEIETYTSEAYFKLNQ